MSEHTQAENVATGFNREEPRYAVVALFGLGTVVIIAILIFALEFVYDRYREQQVYVKQQVPIWQDLRSLRAREEGELHSYGYVDKARGVVRIPIERAMDLLVQEAVANKLPYDTAPKPVPPPPQTEPRPSGSVLITLPDGRGSVSEVRTDSGAGQAVQR